MVNGCRSRLVNVVTRVPQGSKLGQVLFLLYTMDLFPYWRIQLSKINFPYYNYYHYY